MATGSATAGANADAGAVSTTLSTIQVFPVDSGLAKRTVSSLLVVGPDDWKCVSPVAWWVSNVEPASDQSRS
ncbi:MAG: hypothetical protein BWX88_05342 [Planctomycetes bacterium ADurb.Bin126]|nr:MAG: hypothetical protein BWX88_05342 [Planctomycetes bacterium ADurb.Bin126]